MSFAATWTDLEIVIVSGIMFMQAGGGSKSSLQASLRLSFEGVCVLAKCNSIPPRGLTIKVGNELFHFCKV